MTNQGKSKNRCGQCGELKRGHVCRAPRALVHTSLQAQEARHEAALLKYGDTYSHAVMEVPVVEQGQGAQPPMLRPQNSMDLLAFVAGDRVATDGDHVTATDAMAPAAEVISAQPYWPSQPFFGCQTGTPTELSGASSSMMQSGVASSSMMRSGMEPESSTAVFEQERRVYEAPRASQFYEATDLKQTTSNPSTELHPSVAPLPSDAYYPSSLTADSAEGVDLPRNAGFVTAH